MKIILTALVILCSGVLANKTLPEGTSEGKILKVLDVMGYNYLKVDQNGTLRWVAIAKAPVQVGDLIGYDTKTVMKNFKSKQLDIVFDEIVFANSVYLLEKSKKIMSLKDSLAISTDLNKDQREKDNTKDKNLKPFVEKEFYTVAEVHQYKKELNGKIIKIKAKVYKVSKNIMKRDWVHLGDGTGNEQALTDDFVVTTRNSNLTRGQEVIATFTIAINKNFGFGYFYGVLGEDGSFK